MGETQREGRWTGSWLAGSGESPSNARQRYRGERLGLPESGPRSVAGQGRKLAALLVDLVIAGLIASLVLRTPLTDTAAMVRQNYWGVLIWYVLTVLGQGCFGFSPGMALLGLRVVRMDGTPRAGVLRALARTVGIAILVPACIWDADNRGLHDKVVGTVVINAR